MKTGIWMDPYVGSRLYALLDEPFEVSAFLVSDEEDPRRVVDVRLPPQVCSRGSTSLVDGELPGFFDALRAEGIDWQRVRMWFHTHPEGLTRPSGTDEQTFLETFGLSDWAAMVILTKDNRWYARVRTGGRIFPISQEVSVEVLYGNLNFPAVTDEVRARWKQEVIRAVQPIQGLQEPQGPIVQVPTVRAPSVRDWKDYMLEDIWEIPNE